MLRSSSLALLVALPIAMFACGCQRDVPNVELSREEPSRQTVRGVPFVELFERDANDTSPLLVALHGRGDTPEGFARAWHDFPVKLEIAVPQALLPYGPGRQWFDWPRGSSEDQFAAAVGAAEATLWPVITELAHGRKVMIAGFSQGAVLAYVLAVRHPDAITYAFPIAGRIPHPLLPAAGTRTAPVYALHGTADTTLGIWGSREAIAALQSAGGVAELREFPGVGHTITPAMRAALVDRIRAVLAPR
jgi:phospholipase/carboxylesterase